MTRTLAADTWYQTMFAWILTNGIAVLIARPRFSRNERSPELQRLQAKTSEANCSGRNRYVHQR